VSAPIEWDELEDPSLRRGWDHDPVVPDRLARIGDPFRTAADLDQVLPPVSQPR